MAKIRFVVATLACVAIGVGACGGSSDSGGGSSVPLTDLPGKLAHAYCGDVQACLGDLYALFANGEDCIQTTQASVEQGDFSLLQGAIDAKRVSYHADKVDGCIAALSGKGCDIFGKRLPGACKDVFQGTVADGQDCTLNEECMGDSVCVIGSACPGKCAPLAVSGGKCDSDDDCQDGLACDASSSTCKTIPGLGDPCKGGNPDCGLGYFCVGSNDTAGTPGTCTAYADVFSVAFGQPCDLAAGKFCASGAVCEVTDITTQPPTELCVARVASGAACKVAGPDECPDGEYCQIPQGMYAGTCTPLPAAGNACGSGAFGATPCAAYTRCDTTTGKCVALQDDGGSCSDDSICHSAHCMNGTCAASQCSN